MSEDLSGKGRISGFFDNEQIMGSYLSRLFPLVIGLMIYNFNHLKNFNFLLIFFIVIVNIAIFISGERSALAYCLLINITILFLSYKYNFQFLISIILSLIFFVFILVYNKNLSFRYIEYTSQQFTSTVLNESDIGDFKYEEKEMQKFITNTGLEKLPTGFFIFSLEHQQLFSQAINIFSKNFLFGIGPKIYRIECHNPIYRTKIIRTGPSIKENKGKIKSSLWEPYDEILSGCSTHPHNIYLQLLAEVGVLGTLPLFIFLLFIVNIFRKIFFEKIKKIKKSNIKIIDVFVYLTILIAIWPLIPTGSFFNNWLNSINFLCLGFYLYVYEYKKTTD